VNARKANSTLQGHFTPGEETRQESSREHQLFLQPKQTGKIYTRKSVLLQRKHECKEPPRGAKAFGAW